MTEKELERQAKKYKMRIEDIKKCRLHIKPFLQYAISRLKSSESKIVRGLCYYTSTYCETLHVDENMMILIENYLDHRLSAARPKESGAGAFWWTELSSAFNSALEVQENYAFHIQKRIEFCELQLKIVKP